MSHRQLATELLKIHEGYMNKVYKCSAGVLTIGYGRNLESRGLTQAEAEFLLRNDIAEADKWCSDNLVYFKSLSTARKAAIIDMYVNLGPSGLLGFKKMHKALASGNYAQASVEMLDSRWATQVGKRSVELAQIIKQEYIYNE
tara:strand:- start:6310 stop:6738 length:429 start_codon:yes stop_codon:yes gene_type:complete